MTGTITNAIRRVKHDRPAFAGVLPTHRATPAPRNRRWPFFGRRHCGTYGFGEVILASLFTQMIALASPLFFQVVVDKVLVHRSLSTLDVLAFGMLAITVFDVLLNGLRTYIFSHTTSRVDVELGARLFDHPVGLPLGYFERRPVGKPLPASVNSTTSAISLPGRP